MKTRIARVSFFIIAAGLLIYGIFLERHQVRSLSDDSAKAITGPGFTQAAITDDFMRRQENLYDVYSLSKSTATEKDCKT